MRTLLEQFDELCDLSAAEVELRLARIRLEDPHLVEQLQAMLAADGKATELFARDIARQNLLGDGLTETLQLADFGPYRLLRQLGSGGMGVVYLAERKLAASSQQVALKFVRHWRNPELLRHFARESETLAKLEHPGIARLIDVGVNPDGVPFIATEYVEGLALLDFARQRQLSLFERLRLIEDLCEAVDCAHRRLIVHRDIKPSNVMVDHDGHVRLLDFGIAKVLESGDTTRTHNNPLSPAYAAPEQMLAEPISTATDVFGLGLLLFELLAGQLPAQRRALNPLDMARQIAQETIEAPSNSCVTGTAAIDSVVQARDWSKRLRGDLDLIVLKALKREPERRYGSVLALAADLRRFREGRAIAARPDSTWYRLRKVIARNRLLVAAVTVTVVSLVVGLGAALWQADVAREHARRADAQVLREAQVRAFFVRRLHSKETNSKLLMSDWIKDSIPVVETELVQNPEAQVEILSSFAQALSELGENQAAIEAFDRSLEKLKGLEYDDGLRVEAIIRSDRAGAFFKRGDVDEAERGIKTALALFDRVKQQSDQLRQNRISSRTTLLRIENARGNVRGALVIGLGNLEDRKLLFGIDAAELAVDHHNLSTIQLQIGDYAAARSNAERTLVLLSKLPEGGGANAAHAHLILSLQWAAQARYDLARTHMQQVRALREQFLPPLHPDVLINGQWVAILEMLDGTMERAEQALSVLPALKSANSLQYASALAVYAYLKTAQRRPDEALKAADEVIAGVPSGVTPAYLPRVIAVRALSLAQLAQAKPSLLKDAQAATVRADESIAAMFNDDGFSPLFRADAAVYLAAAHRALGNRSPADTWQARAMQSYLQSMSAEQAERRAQAWIRE